MLLLVLLTNFSSFGIYLISFFLLSIIKILLDLNTLSFLSVYKVLLAESQDLLMKIFAYTNFIKTFLYDLFLHQEIEDYKYQVLSKAIQLILYFLFYWNGKKMHERKIQYVLVSDIL